MPLHRAMTVESIIVKVDRQHVFHIARTYPKFVRAFRKTKVLLDADKTNVFEIYSSLLGMPVSWIGKGRRKAYSEIRFLQLKGLLRGLRAAWRFEVIPEGTRVTIRTEFKIRTPIVGKILRRVFVNKVQTTTRAILNDLKVAAESEIYSMTIDH